MKNRILIALILLILLSTITPQVKNFTSFFNIKDIKVKNNLILSDNEIRKLLDPIFNRNLFFLDTLQIEKLLSQSSLIKGFDIKKKYPNILILNIYEKKPIAILQIKKKKFYLSEEIELIEFNIFKNYQDLPYVFGNQEDFKNFYEDLNKIDFPLNLIKKYILYDAGRWDLETIDKKIIKLPTKNHLKSLENFLNLKDKKEFKKYKIFDFRIKNQLILK